MENKDAKRIQESILSKLEKKALEWLSARMPKWVTPDFLTGIGLAGAVIASAGYILSNWGKGFLWLSSIGFVVNWYGDSLDGTLAREKSSLFLTSNIQRPFPSPMSPERVYPRIS